VNLLGILHRPPTHVHQTTCALNHNGSVQGYLAHRKCLLLGPCCRLMHGALWGSKGGRRFLMGEVSLCQFKPRGTAPSEGTPRHPRIPHRSSVAPKDVDVLRRCEARHTGVPRPYEHRAVLETHTVVGQQLGDQQRVLSLTQNVSIDCSRATRDVQAPPALPKP